MIGRPSTERGSNIWSSVLALVPMLLVAAAMFNIATWGQYAAIQGDRRGFRIGQSDVLADRIQASGRAYLSRGWHLHLRIDELLDEGDVLVLPADNPLDTRLLTYLAGVDWTTDGAADHGVSHSELSKHLDAGRIWHTEEGVGVAVFAGTPAAEVFQLRRVEGERSEIGWVVAPGSFWQEALKVSQNDG